MKRYLISLVALLMLSNARSLVAGQTEVLKELPKNYTLSFEAIVYVENDGRCKDEEEIKVTGEKKSDGIPRKYECVKRPK
ncbi:hypothetical protein [Candidatus Accumulibacter sp. ACC003]|uniref:hypothetical protein n=1 Tax=Candidatus Accumulibacter sp. ACC003 TaxID=2823334 RepID=UPI0025B9A946|nr:hypothetical protein [Candidatus Accumulibacter sp. ACC003]